MSAATPSAPVAARLSMLDRFLPVWIGVAMVAGLLLGRLVPSLAPALEAVDLHGISLPIAIGLLVMMYPPLAKVRYDRLGTVTGDRRMMLASLVLNWVLGPALMFALAWLFLPDLPEYRTGLIIVGLARCIAMVIIWNDLACGDRDAAAVLVALNALFQIVAFAALGVSVWLVRVRKWPLVAKVLAWCGLSTFVTFTLGMPLAATKLYLFGMSVDQEFRTEYLTRLTDSPALRDMTYADTPPFYPAGWFWIGGRVANVLGCTSGWQEIIARTDLRDEIGKTSYLKTECRRVKEPQ